jgi:non-ribosomal peptide synthetase component E (peptide arylation enzyme)
VKVDTIQAGDFLRLSAQRFADRDCFVFDDGSSRSFGETNRRVNQLAGALHRRGVRKGDRVAILATDSGEYVEVLMACMKLGVVYVPLNNRRGRRRHRAGGGTALLPAAAGVLQGARGGDNHPGDAAERQRQDPQARVAGPAPGPVSAGSARR